ncbi:MAG: AAA family ATPase [Coriobacteriales bacterium]|jgi:cell division protease FtsH
MGEMNAFDKIVGYESIKRELTKTADMLSNDEPYRKLNVTMPHGLLLYGKPGVGKSLMASCLIEASGRPTFTCRKAEPNGEFVKTITSTFKQAKEKSPSIVFLDDLDKFANDDINHCDSEEYVTVQSCIDEVGDKNVFVLATANEINKLPKSLKRPGRFDRIINVGVPTRKDIVPIVGHFLKGKRLADDVNPVVVADLLYGHSCATLETVINEAGLMAGFERAALVEMRHLVKSFLMVVHHVSPELIDQGEPVDLATNSAAAHLIWHEAGHATMQELLFPNSVSLVFAGLGEEDAKAFTVCKNDFAMSVSESDWQNKVMVGLAGREATFMNLGRATGCDYDLDKSLQIIRGAISEEGIAGFSLLDSPEFGSSEDLFRAEEAVTSAVLEICSKKVRMALLANRELLTKIAEELATTGVLTALCIKKIRKSCELKPLE